MKKKHYDAGGRALSEYSSQAHRLIGALVERSERPQSVRLQQGEFVRTEEFNHRTRSVFSRGSSIFSFPQNRTAAVVPFRLRARTNDIQLHVDPNKRERPMKTFEHQQRQEKYVKPKKRSKHKTKTHKRTNRKDHSLHLFLPPLQARTHQ